VEVSDQQEVCMVAECAAEVLCQRK
jgi:hypothetical protein